MAQHTFSLGKLETFIESMTNRQQSAIFEINYKLNGKAGRYTILAIDYSGQGDAARVRNIGKHLLKNYVNNGNKKFKHTVFLYGRYMETFDKKEELAWQKAAGELEKMFKKDRLV